VGIKEGLEEGRIEGLNVGFAVTPAVGCRVGRDDGRTVEIAVGNLVGAFSPFAPITLMLPWHAPSP